MPARNIVKTYVKDGVYHIYNRGVEKRVIFQDDQDFNVFLKYLKEYLSPLANTHIQGIQGGTLQRPHKNYNNKIELLAYCLMPNHFHLLVKQYDNKTIQDFIRSLCTRYSMYFNKKYKRVGKLFQGHYKARLINDDPYLLHVSRYIHLNPYENNKDLTNAFSSYQEYLKLRKSDWIKSEMILNFFNQAKEDFLTGVITYKSFVENYNKPISYEFLGDDSESYLQGGTL